MLSRLVKLNSILVRPAVLQKKSERATRLEREHMLWKAQSSFSMGQWLGVFERKKNSMHAFVFSFCLFAYKKKIFPNVWLRYRISILTLATVSDACRNTAKPQSEIRKRQRSTKDKHSSTVTFMLTNGQCDICKTQSKCMPCKVNGDTTGWAKEHQASQTGEGLHYKPQLDAKGSKWCS